VVEVLSGVTPGSHPLLEQAFRLRHDVFVEEFGWELLRCADGREIDQFDDVDAVHLLAIRNGDVVGYKRLRPTTKPHLLSDVHSHLCQRRYRRSPKLWEWTRYCVRRDYRADAGVGGIGSELLVAGMEWCLHREIRDIVLEYHPRTIDCFRRLGFKVYPLGFPGEFDGQPIIAARMHFDEKTLELARTARRLYQSVLTESSACRTAAMPNDFHLTTDGADHERRRQFGR
jgi:acyl-homoserine lactone synthase